MSKGGNSKPFTAMAFPVVLAGSLVALAAGSMAFLLLRFQTGSGGIGSVVPEEGVRAGKEVPQKDVPAADQGGAAGSGISPEGSGDGISGLFAGAFGEYLVAGLFVVAVLACLVLVAVALLGMRSSRSSFHPQTGARAGTAGGFEERAVHRPPVEGVEKKSPLEDERWLNLVRECVGMVDELDLHMSSFDAPRREVAEHAVMRLQEILARSGVEVISDERSFDRNRHKPEGANGSAPAGASVAETISPGFAVDRLVLRRARVRLE